MSARPWEWRVFYHLSNTKLNEVGANIHSKLTCLGRIFKRIESHDPDVVVSVHPTMNHTPLLATQKLGKKQGKHIPFFTVVTDLGSGHCMWFEKNVNKVYVASDRLYKLARRGGTPAENIVMAGLPIRHGFAVQAEKLGDRTTEKGKEYQKSVKKGLELSTDKPMVLVMGGGEGVGSLSAIVDQLYTKLRTLGVDATICVVCGRNEKLKAQLESRDWDTVSESLSTDKKRRGLLRFLRRRGKTNDAENVLESYLRAEEAAETNDVKGKGQVDVVGLGFITNMPDYMVAADILVTKAGPGTIAEAASVGLPVMLTR
jgi:1,2-diacylglycerol 3-beta-galactosyltransferase